MLNVPFCSYFFITDLKYSAILFKLCKLSLGSLSVSLSVEARDSVAGWDVPEDKGDIARSTMSIPASIAFKTDISPIPPVQ